MKKGNDLVTKNDLEKFGVRLEKRLEQKLELKLEQKLEQKLELKLAQQSVLLEKSIRNGIWRDLDEKLTMWKSDIFNLVDDLAGEIRDGREHRQITAYQVENHRERIEKLERQVFGAVSQA